MVFVSKQRFQRNLNLEDPKKLFLVNCELILISSILDFLFLFLEVVTFVDFETMSEMSQ